MTHQFVMRVTRVIITVTRVSRIVCVIVFCLPGHSDVSGSRLLRTWTPTGHFLVWLEVRTTFTFITEPFSDL